MAISRAVLLLVATSISTTFFGEEAKPMSADQLVAKNIEAKGGAQAIDALKTLKLSGKLLLNNGQIQLGYVQTRKEPGEVRTDATVQGMTIIQAYDGKEGWKVYPLQGRKDPEKLSADDCKSLIEDAEMVGPLPSAKENGSTVTYVGREDVEGTSAYKLKVTRKNGDTDFVYLDPDAFLDIRVVSQRMEQGAQIETETDLGDYEKIAGVFIPFSVESGERHSTDKQKIVIEKAEPNVAVDDSIFHFPAAPVKK